MFLKADLSTKKIWSNYPKSSEENYDNWNIFSSQGQQQSQLKKQCSEELSLASIGTCNQQSMKQSGQEKGEQQFPLKNSISRMGHWLNSLPENFETPRPISPVTVRSLLDPVWRTMTDEEITERGNGWDSDFSLLKQIYENNGCNAETIFGPNSKDELKFTSPSNSNGSDTRIMSCDCDCVDDPFRLLNQNLMGDSSFPTATSSNTTLCNSIKKIGSLDSINTESIASSTSPSASSSPVMETTTDGIQTSSEDSFYTAKSRLSYVRNEPTKSDNLNELKNNFINPTNNVEPNAITTNDVSNSDETLDSSADVLSSASSTSRPKTNSRGKQFDGHCKEFIPRNAVPASENGITNLKTQPLVPVRSTMQPSSPPFVPSLSPWHMACTNAAYNHFMNLQTPKSEQPHLYYNRSTLPLLGHVGGTPLVPYMYPTNVLLANPNPYGIIPSFYNNATLFRVLQQQIIVQKQQILAAATFLLQQQQHQNQNQNQRQQQQQQRQRQYHQANQRRQNNMRNSRYRQSWQNSQNKLNNNQNNQNNKKNQNQNNGNSK